MEMNLHAGDVAMVTTDFGEQSKTRPAIVLETAGRGVYICLGSTKNLVNDKHSLVVNDCETMKMMGLKFHTRFGFGNEADQWIDARKVERVVGRINEQTAQRLGQAWANSRFVRAE